MSLFQKLDLYRKERYMICFGPSGNDDLFYEQGFKSSVDVFAWLNKMGLDLYEYSFGRGILLKDETALEFAEKAKESNIKISVHAPYFVNLANPDETSILKSFAYIDNSLKKLLLMGGKKCVVHIGSCMKMPREIALQNVKNNLQKFMEYFDKEYKDNDIYVCPETMGKYQQIGTYEEIIDLCALHKNLIPTLDFGHINSVMQGGLDYEQYKKIIEYMIAKLGYDKAKMVHIHFSKIEYASKGEVRHLTLDDTKYGPDFEPLARLLKEYKLDETTIICESKNIMAQDARKLKDIFNAV